MISPSEVEQICAEHKGSLYRLARKKINRQTVLVSVCHIKTGLKGRQEVWVLEKDIDKDAICHRFFLTYTPYLTKQALEGFGVFGIGQAIRTVKYSDHLLVVAKAGTVL